MRSFATSAIMFLLLSMTGPALAEQEAEFDWQVWDYLATQDGGRHKPLDSLARETLCTLSNRKSLADPDTGRRLTAVQLYLMFLFDWRGWDQPQPGGADLSGHRPRAYFGLHQGDKWDHLPLIRVDDLALRTALGIDRHAKHISPYDLSQAKIEVPATHEQRPFLLWAEGLLRRNKNELDAHEKKALELANRYWSYEQHRMGQRLRVLPNCRAPDQPWMTVAELSRAKFDDQTDPTGRLRKAQTLWGSIRAAYRRGAAAEFNQASAAWLSDNVGLGTRHGRRHLAIQHAPRSELQPWGPVSHRLDLHDARLRVSAAERGIAVERLPGGGLECVPVRTRCDHCRIRHADCNHRTSAGDQHV